MIATALLVLLALAPAAPTSAQTQPPALAAPLLADGAHDFDFELGEWRARITRRLRPLTGSNDWVIYEGSSVVRPVWNGAANLGELDVQGSAGHIRGLSLRLYNPQTRQWTIRWSNANDGVLGAAMVGSFSGQTGLFYDQEDLGGRSIMVRFVFSGISQHSFRIEQAFSADGGSTWETNWIADFSR